MELTIESLAAGGDGVARDDSGRVTFVPRSAVGDRLRVDLIAAKKRFARGRLRELVEPSPDRVEPACALFDGGPCGGCQWLHIARPAQLRAKQAIVAGALRHEVEAGLELRDILDPAPALGWRRRARMHWVRRRRGGALVGFYQPGSDRVVDVRACPQVVPEVMAAAAAVRDGVELLGRGELMIVVGKAGGAHVVIAGGVRGDVAGLVGTGGIAGIAWGEQSAGAPAVEIDDGVTVRADAFCQASAAGNAALVAAVADLAGDLDGRRVLELYAGAGNFTRVLRDRAKRVVAVDEAPGALPGVSWRKGDVADVAATLVEVGQEFDVVVLDPPRSGAKDVLAAISALQAERIVYVSCDPATLGRDMAALRRSGYRGGVAQPVDLMPQTAHVEVVAVMTR